MNFFKVHKDFILNNSNASEQIYSYLIYCKDVMNLDFLYKIKQITINAKKPFKTQNKLVVFLNRWLLKNPCVPYNLIQHKHFNLDGSVENNDVISHVGCSVIIENINMNYIKISSYECFMQNLNESIKILDAQGKISIHIDLIPPDVIAKNSFYDEYIELYASEIAEFGLDSREYSKIIWKSLSDEDKSSLIIENPATKSISTSTSAATATSTSKATNIDSTVSSAESTDISTDNKEQLNIMKYIYCKLLKLNKTLRFSDIKKHINISSSHDKIIDCKSNVILKQSIKKYIKTELIPTLKYYKII